MSRDFRSVDPAIRFSMTSTYKNSLNLPYRKKETNRIEQENQAFARRLFERTSNLNKKKLDDDYREHQKYLRQITKMKPSNSFAIAAGLTMGGTPSNATSF